jgi:hypothetical protein
MSRHRRHEEAIHRTFGSLEKVRGFGGVKSLAPRRDGKLVVEGRPESKEPFDGLAER